MKQGSWIFKLIVFTLPALFLTLLMAEIALRVGASAYLALTTRKHSEQKIFSNSNVRILCLGDSFTFGLGVPPEESYPAQLEQLLKQNGYDSVTVYNAGVPGLSSSLAANKLHSLINEHNPDFIIIMLGTSNMWNFEDSSHFLLSKINPKPSDYFERILSKTSLYKLAKIWYLTIKKKEPIFLDKESAATIDLDSATAYQTGDDFRRVFKYELAEEHFDKALSIDPYNFEAWMAKATMLAARRDYELAEDALSSAIFLIDRYDEKKLKGFLNATIKVFPRPDKRLGMIERLESSIEKFVADDKKRKRFLEITKASKELLTNATWARKILMYDLSRMIALMQQKNIKVMLQTYPFDHSANAVLREMSRTYELPLIDQARLFKSRRINRRDLWLSKYDHHYNARGNRIIAENIMDVLVRGDCLSQVGKDAAYR